MSLIYVLVFSVIVAMAIPFAAKMFHAPAPTARVAAANYGRWEYDPRIQVISEKKVRFLSRQGHWRVAKVRDIRRGQVHLEFNGNHFRRPITFA